MLNKYWIDYDDDGDIDGPAIESGPWNDPGHLGLNLGPTVNQLCESRELFHLFESQLSLVQNLANHSYYRN